MPHTVNRSTLAGLGVIAGASILFELTLTRLISVALWYPFAFVSLGVAVLGFGCAAAAVAIWPKLRLGDDDLAMAYGALGFAITVALGYPLWNNLPLAPLSLSTDPSQWWWMALFLLIIGLPFVGAGFFVARVFISAPAKAPLLYGVDLAGAAIGVVIYVLTEPVMGAPGTLFIAAAFGVIAALLVWVPAVAIRLGIAAVGMGMLSIAPQVEGLMPLRLSPNKILGTAIQHKTRGPTLWSVSSAIDVLPVQQGLQLVIDGGTAMTLIPKAPLRQRADIPPPIGLRALPYLLNPSGSTLVIGAGGGAEVKAALGAKVQRIVAVEIDSTITDLMQTQLAAYHGGLFSRKEVELHTAEARGFLESTDERFDVIVAFHTISNAASSSGALSLAESYLLTEEALELQLEHLSNEGVLLISRPETQLGRLLHMLAEAAQRKLSISTEKIGQHVMLVSYSNNNPAFLSAILFSKLPFTEAKAQEVAAQTPGRILYRPHATQPTGDSLAYMQAALAGDNALAHELRPGFADLQSATDDRPFFNMFKSWGAIAGSDFGALFGAGVHARARLEDLPMGQLALLMLLILSGAVTIAVLVPAGVFVRKSGVPMRVALKTGAVFAIFGCGFMLIEVVLIQQLTRIVGEPGWSLVVVLSLLLASSGFGGFWFAGVKSWSPLLGALAAALAALVTGIVIPFVLDMVGPWPFALRIFVAGMAVVPIGVLMGIPFSATLKSFHAPDPKLNAVLTAWAWAVSSFASVFGSVGALIISSAWGFMITALGTAVVYLCAAYLLRTALLNVQIEDHA